MHFTDTLMDMQTYITRSLMGNLYFEANSF